VRAPHYTGIDFPNQGPSPPFLRKSITLPNMAPRLRIELRKAGLEDLPAYPLLGAQIVV